MKFNIKRGSPSGRSWGDVDKGRLWRLLSTGLKEGVDGAREAVREMYAVVKADIGPDLTQADCWGPHHEITEDGTLVLSRGGVIAAAAALAGARSEPDLTDAQRAEARTHLRRHYEELELPLPDALGGELVRLSASVTGEIAVEDVPLAPGVDLAALKAGDEDPLEVVVEIPSGRSKRRWHYLPQALQSIVRQVAQETASGFLGHQKPEDVDYQFPPPVTHWVGALFRDGKAYIRGVIDQAAKDLKRWIRAGRVRQVSIFGVPTLQTVGGETQVVDYRLLSIDWVPLDRAGMQTRVVAVGEMDAIEPAAGGGEGNRGGVKAMTFQEVIAKLKELGAKPAQIAGEMGWKLDELIAELDPKQHQLIGEMKSAIKDLAETFGLGADRPVKDLVEATKAARKAQLDAFAAEQAKLIDKVVGEMVVHEPARPLIRRMLQVPAGVDEAAVRKAVGELLQQEDVKAALAAAFKDVQIAPVQQTDPKDNPPSGLRPRRVAI